MFALFSHLSLKGYSSVNHRVNDPQLQWNVTKNVRRARNEREGEREGDPKSKQRRNTNKTKTKLNSHLEGGNLWWNCFMIHVVTVLSSKGHDIMIGSGMLGRRCEEGKMRRGRRRSGNGLFFVLLSSSTRCAFVTLIFWRKKMVSDSPSPNQLTLFLHKFYWVFDVV